MTVKRRIRSSGPTPLSVPSWVPPAIAAQARESYSHFLLLPTDESERLAGAVRRLGTDPRMRQVWSALVSCRGGRARSVGFVHPARSAAVRQQENTEGANLVLKALRGPERLQQQAMANIFSNAVMCFAWDRAGAGPRTRTKAHADAEVRDLGALARQIRNDAAQLQQLGGSRFVRDLEFAAANCDLQAELAHAASRNDPFIVQRHSDRLGDDWVRGFIIDMSAHFQALFGNRMLGLVAIMANVAFGRTDLTENKVRGVFRRPDRSAK